MPRVSPFDDGVCGWACEGDWQPVLEMRESATCRRRHKCLLDGGSRRAVGARALGADSSAPVSPQCAQTSTTRVRTRSTCSTHCAWRRPSLRASTRLSEPRVHPLSRPPPNHSPANPPTHALAHRLTSLHSLTNTTPTHSTTDHPIHPHCQPHTHPRHQHKPTRTTRTWRTAQPIYTRNVRADHPLDRNTDALLAPLPRDLGAGRFLGAGRALAARYSHAARRVLTASLVVPAALVWLAPSALLAVPAVRVAPVGRLCSAQVALCAITARPR